MSEKRVRAGGFAGVAELALEAGLDPLALADQAGLAHEAFVNPDFLAPISVVQDFLTRTIAASGAEDFALRLGQRQTAFDFGFLAATIRQQPSLRRIFQALKQYISVHHESFSISVVEVGGAAEIHLDHTTGATPFFERCRAEIAVSALTKHIRETVGEGWRADWVSFRHARPASVDAHRTILGAECRFGQSFDGFGVDLEAFDRPLGGRQLPRLAEEASRYADSFLRPASRDVADRALDVCLARLSAGAASCGFVAKALQLSVRSLQRRLAEEGTTFANVVNGARRQLARNYIAVADMSMAEIAGLLGFSSQSAFNHWYRRAFGEAPSESRRRLAGAPEGASA